MVKGKVSALTAFALFMSTTIVSAAATVTADADLDKSLRGPNGDKYYEINGTSMAETEEHSSNVKEIRIDYILYRNGQKVEDGSADGNRIVGVGSSTNDYEEYDDATWKLRASAYLSTYTGSSDTDTDTDTLYVTSPN